MNFSAARIIRNSFMLIPSRKCASVFHFRAQPEMSTVFLSRVLNFERYQAQRKRQYCTERDVKIPTIHSGSTTVDPTPKNDGVLHRLHMVFTCTKCETRAVKSFTKNAYEKGVVIVICPGCDARHLIADNLGWFGEDRNIEEVLAKRGESVVRITDGDIDYSP